MARTKKQIHVVIRVKNWLELERDEDKLPAITIEKYVNGSYLYEIKTHFVYDLLTILSDVAGKGQVRISAADYATLSGFGRIDSTWHVIDYSTSETLYSFQEQFVKE